MKKLTIGILISLIVIFITVPTIYIIYQVNNPYDVVVKTAETTIYQHKTCYPDPKGGEWCVYDWVCDGNINDNESAVIMNIKVNFTINTDLWVFRQLVDNGYGSGITIFEQQNITAGYHEITYTPSQVVTLYHINNQKLYTLLGDYPPIDVDGNISMTITYAYIK